LDASSGACVVAIGHGRKEMAEALREQAERAAFVIWSTSRTSGPSSSRTRSSPSPPGE
jgi:adenosylmethionine-8-amino-7-oxononanoate aminotransferase